MEQTTSRIQRHSDEPHIAARLLRRFGLADGCAHLVAALDREAGASIHIRGLTGSSRALLAALLAERTGRMQAVIVPDASSAHDLRDDLTFLLGPRSAAVLPDPGLQPYRPQHPRVAIRAERIEVLAALCRPDLRTALPACSHLRVLVIPAVALSVPVPRPERFQTQFLALRVGDETDLSELVGRLVRMGYAQVPLVGEYGDMSRRGGILDVYSFGRENPLRIEFDGDRVESLREFDPFSQRSLASMRDAVVLPLWEWIPGDEERLHLEGSLKESPDLAERLQSLDADGTLEGIEWSLSLFGNWRARLLDYLPRDAVVVVDGPTFVRSRRQAWLEDLQAAWADLAWSTGGGQAEARGSASRARKDEMREMLELLGEDAADALRAAGEAPPGSHALSLPPGPPASIFWIDDRWEELGWPGALLHLGSGGAEIEAEAHSDLAAGGDGGGADPPSTARDEPDPLQAGISEAGSGDRRVIEIRTRPPERFGRNLQQTRDYLLRLYDETPEIHILCDTENHRDRLYELLPRAPAQFHVGNLGAGFILPEAGLAVLTDHEIFSRSRRRSAGRRYSRGISLKELLALTQGDYVVHIDHGIGRYLGLERLVVNGQETDCLTLEYHGGDRHYVPVDQLSLVQKYSAEEGVRPQLSRLGGKSWTRTKERVKKSIREMAGKLLRTYALRKSRKGFAFSPDTTWMRQLEASFLYEETADQLQSIEEVKRDLEAESPMDRLICGDVGYGKTEVAIRAAFKAAQDGKQTAVLVPTTLLARQHYDTFRERLKEYPIQVDFLSRFRTAAESRQVKQALKEGKIDIIIGTHAILAKDIAFRDLGLVVVDEEQLFGVAAKERLKEYRATVDVLTLTATPIPRTMHLALMGGRDMSTILTPPRDRRPIQTEILEFRDDVIAHALMREADRGGQSFFVHNRVMTIDPMANYLGRLVPHLRLGVAHGQMRERALEDVMRRFLAGEVDVLVSTMIIESGLDLPNVNTILINRGDTFGLAQLYQLRGRVGRSSRKAYAYLLVPPYHSITEAAQKRLKAMEEFEDLGSGYQLALRDLEIRGAGNLLGAEQHGFIVNVGFELYTQLLDEAVRELKGEARDEYVEPRMATDIEAYLPDEYVPDSREKMNLYKSLADARSQERVDEISSEMIDRFGKHPDPVRHLLGLRRVRILGARLRCEKVTVRQDLVELELGRDLKRTTLETLVRSVPFALEFSLGGRHRVRLRSPGAGEAVSAALILLRALEKAEALRA